MDIALLIFMIVMLVLVVWLMGGLERIFGFFATYLPGLVIVAWYCLVTAACIMVVTGNA